jgi:hypothetical protein
MSRMLFIANPGKRLETLGHDSPVGRTAQGRMNEK